MISDAISPSPAIIAKGLVDLICIHTHPRVCVCMCVRLRFFFHAVVRRSENSLGSSSWGFGDEQSGEEWPFDVYDIISRKHTSEKHAHHSSHRTRKDQAHHRMEAKQMECVCKERDILFLGEDAVISTSLAPEKHTHQKHERSHKHGGRECNRLGLVSIGRSSAALGRSRSRGPVDDRVSECVSHCFCAPCLIGNDAYGHLEACCSPGKRQRESHEAPDSIRSGNECM